MTAARTSTTASSRTSELPAADRPPTIVAIGLGSNMPHGRFGRPRDVLRAAVAALARSGLGIVALSPIIRTAPLGPSRRRFANAVVKGRWGGSAPALLACLKRIEHDFGRKSGRRWGARVLDCDLLAFGADIIAAPHLQVPHPQLARRDFVLQPLAAVWPEWRHPQANLSVRQLRARLRKAKAVD